ncbi:putative transposase [Trichonephila clavipes]|nr:putative transposase [Trichonephila clavipes]
MAGKDILEFFQSSLREIDADSKDEKEINNAASVPTSSEMRNDIKSIEESEMSLEQLKATALGTIDNRFSESEWLHVYTDSSLLDRYHGAEAGIFCELLSFYLPLGVAKCVTLFGGVRGTTRNSSACKQQQGRYTNYCCNPYGKAAPNIKASIVTTNLKALECNEMTVFAKDLFISENDWLTFIPFPFFPIHRIHSRLNNAFEWAQNEIAVVPDFHKRILFSDEAYFWLSGYVNKQNCRIWSEANPQVYVETPLHPEKLTVWCALWAGGILLQKR